MMKNTTLCIVLLLSGSRMLAGEAARQLANCRELVAAVRPSGGDGEDGRQYLDDADRAYQECRGEKLPLDIRVDALFKYGIAAAARERSQTAIAAYGEALALLERAGSQHAPRMIDILDSLSYEESRSNLQTNAIDHAKRAADLRAQAYGHNSAEAAEGLAHLAMMYVTFKDYATAEKLLRDAIRIADKACGPACAALVDAYSGMAVLSDARGNADEAKKYETLAMEAVPTPRASSLKH